MKAIVCDVRRALAGRWFWAALLATTAALYLSIGQAADALMDDTQNLRFTLSKLLLMALYGDFGMLTLPALSALPFAAQALHEIKCGAVRPAVFRAGRRMWILGKAAGCILSGMVLQAAATGLLGLIMHAVRGGGILLEINAEFNAALLRRMLCGGIWASVGCVMALATETSSAAHLGPLCLCYALMMLGKRFFPAAVMLNPINWIDGGDGMLAGLETVSILLQIVFLKRGVREYV